MDDPNTQIPIFTPILHIRFERDWGGGVAFSLNWTSGAFLILLGIFGGILLSLFVEYEHGEVYLQR